MKPNREKFFASYVLIGAGSIFTGMIISGFLVGYFFDSLFDSKPIFIILCGLLGLIGGFQKLNKLLASENKKTKQ